MGKWKGIRKNIKKGNLSIDLYNLQQDTTEQTNVADQNPEIVEKIEAIMQREHTTPELKFFRMQALDRENDE